MIHKIRKQKLNSNLNKIVRALKKEYKPEKIVLFGSLASGQVSEWSDIDLLIHFVGTNEQRKDLESWLDGWSVSLDYMNFLKTGYKSDGLLDVHIVTDEDIANKTSFDLCNRIFVC